MLLSMRYADSNGFFAVLFPLSFQLPPSRQHSPHSRQEADKEFGEDVRNHHGDRRKQEINNQRDSRSGYRSGKLSCRNSYSFVYESYDDKMDRIKKHALAHPWTDLRKAHSTGKGPTGHRHSHTVKAGPEDGRFRCHHPPVTDTEIMTPARPSANSAFSHEPG